MPEDPSKWTKFAGDEKDKTEWIGIAGGGRLYRTIVRDPSSGTVTVALCYVPATG
jgi:hypothetical protein